MAITAIQDLTSKSTLVAGDLIAVGDSEDSNNPKKFLLGAAFSSIVQADGSIGTHSDVDVSTVAPST